MKIAVIYNRKDYTEQDVINFYGPQTREHYNKRTVDDIAPALEKRGHNVRTIDGNIHVADQLRDFMPKVISGEKPGMVFNMAYGIQGQSRYTHIPAMLEMMGVPYVGSGPQAHAVALDKVLTKIVLNQYKLPTPEFHVFSNAADVCEVRWPVIVKPKMEAVSMGLRVVDNLNDLKDAVAFLLKPTNRMLWWNLLFRGVSLPWVFWAMGVISKFCLLLRSIYGEIPKPFKQKPIKSKHHSAKFVLLHWMMRQPEK